ARKFDLAKSEAMLRKSMEFRKEMKLDDLVQSYKIPQIIQDYYSGNYFGYDKEGSPVLVDPIGNLDIKGLMHCVKKEEIWKYKLYMAEIATVKFKQQSKKLGCRIESMTTIEDMSNLGLKHLWKPGLDCFFKLVKMYEENYPEFLKRVFIINAPAIFPVMYSLMKPFVSEETKQKIFVLGSNWKQVLRQYIDEDQLPKALGGACTDKDGHPYCKSQICLGGEIPKSLYKTDLTICNDDYTTAVINRGATMQIKYEIEDPGTTIRWEFKTDGHDIAFGLYYKEDESLADSNIEEMEKLISVERRDSHLLPEYGSFYCDRTGTYIVNFDNSYSWTRNKRLSYAIDVLKPDLSKDICNFNLIKT
ncbi:uncharacterized protein TRIADDRAFT_29265, partial [Trichoplax adhaerens]